MKVALAQINTSMGAISENAARIERFLRQAEKRGAELTVFPELALVGYPPRDLLEEKAFQEEVVRSADRLIQANPKSSFIFGTIEPNQGVGKGCFNVAILVEKGKVVGCQRKRLLPTYDVYDEARYFEAGDQSALFEFQGHRIGLTICEDIWNDTEIMGRNLYATKPMETLEKLGAELVINISASPYHTGKEKIRRRLMERLVQQFHLPIVYCNLVGGNDELLFDGGSMAVDAKGNILAQGKVFSEDLLLFEVGEGRGDLHSWPEDEVAWISEALRMGVRDYVKKCGFKKVLLGISGGIDSALVALLAVEAMGPEYVMGVTMPSEYTSEETLADARTLAAKLGIPLETLPISSLAEAYDTTLSKVFSGRRRDVTEENIQARIRGALLMALSNKFGHLVLSTGNKTEMAVGYCTQYGDMVGGLAVISDLSKGEVYEVAGFLNQKWKAIPERMFQRPPSAELRPNQKDEDTLPPYEVLDPIVQLYIEERESPESIRQKGFSGETIQQVIDLIQRNEFKRRQAPPGLRLSAKAFGMGRRMPIARGPA